MQRALRERRERAHLLDLVAEELDAEGLSPGRREDVDETAANRELPALLRALDALVAGQRERLGQRVDALLVARRDPERLGPGALGWHTLRGGRSRDDDERALLEEVQSAGALPDEVRRRTQRGIPAHAAARQQGDALRPEVPRDSLGQVACVGVLGHEDRERPPELLVQRRDDERQRGLGDAGARRQRFRELRKPLVLEQLAHEREENGPLFDIPDHDA